MRRDTSHIERHPMFIDPPDTRTPAQKKFRRGDKVQTTFAATKAGYEPQEGVVILVEFRGRRNSVNVSVHGKRAKAWHMDYWEVIERDGVAVTQRVTRTK